MDACTARFRSEYKGPLGRLLLDVARRSDELEETDREARILRLCTGLPFILTGSARASARCRLAYHWMRRYQYDLGAAECSAALSEGAGTVLQEALHHRLSDCLEGLGEMAAASVERQKARRLAQKLNLALARHLVREGRYDEAYEAIARVLAAVSRVPTLRMARARVTLLIHGSTTALRAGRLEDAMRLAEDLIRASEKKYQRSLGHLTAAGALVKKGDPEEAARHRSEALLLAREFGNQYLIARCLSARAMDYLTIGDINRAIDSAALAARTCPSGRREALRVQARCSLARSEGGDAIISLQQALDSPPDPIPWKERRQRIGLYLMLANVEVAHGTQERAEAWLQHARVTLADHETLGLEGERTAARINAGHPSQADAVKIDLPEDPYEYNGSGPQDRE